MTGDEQQAALSHLFPINPNGSQLKQVALNYQSFLNAATCQSAQHHTILAAFRTEIDLLAPGLLSSASS
jgi:hypothetical protein